MTLFKSRPIKVFVFGFLLFAAISPGVSTFAEDKTEKAESTETTALKAGKDPDGGLRPTTPAESKKLNAELNKTLAKYKKHEAKRNEDGSLSLVIAPHLTGLTVATVASDGKIQVDCVDDISEIGKETVNAKETLPEE